MLAASGTRAEKRLRTYKRLRNAMVAVNVFSMAALWWLIVNAPVEIWLAQLLGAVAMIGLVLVALTIMLRASSIHDDIRCGDIIKAKRRDRQV